MQEANHYHSKDIKYLFQQFNTSEKGLTKSEAQKRLAQNGVNEISKKKKTPAIIEFLKQFNSPLIYILMVAMAISFTFHHNVDGYVILVVILINATIGFIQERKAEKAIDALEKLIVSYAKVYRDGEVVKIPARDLVTGDVILLEEGDKIPADARLMEAKNFKTQESSLTGESFPAEKNLKVLSPSVPLGDRTNMVFMSSLVVSGEAKAVVVATANKTQIGKVATSIQAIIRPNMHFNDKVKQLSIQMAIFAFIGALLVFLIGFFINKLEFFEIFLFTIASLVSAIPEGLPAILIIVLAVGARRMAKRNAVIRHLPAVETLGVATIIATDKTGTLTQNSITVEKILTADGDFSVTGDGWQPVGKFFSGKKAIIPLKFPILQKILSIATLCNKGNLTKKGNKYEIIGDPTEVALLVLGKKAGLEKRKLEKNIIDDLPFSSELKFRASLIKTKSGKHLCSVGAFENIIEKSAYLSKSNKKIKFDEKSKKEFLEKAELLAKKGMRVLALAHKNMPSDANSISKESVKDMIFLGLIGMKDPPRKEIKDAIQKARNAGIRVIMKTGDHKETAIAIAKEIGLVTGKTKALTQTELEKMDRVQFREAVKKVDIFTRVTPKMKEKIVKELQEQGEIVAMTGDGVNDAPALKRSDIGVAMGIIGTDVARESSEIVLADDNFASIVNAIEEGRIVFQNVRQTSFFLITTNVAEQVTIISSLAMGMTLPLLPIQLLYLNLVTDTFPGIALSMEPGHHDVLNRPPRNKKERIINKELIPFLILMVGLMALGTIPLFRHFLPQGVDKARTIAFAAMSMFQLFNVFNMRSLKKSIFKIGFCSNKWVLLAFATSFLLMLGVIFLPGISSVFSFVPLTIGELGLILLVTSSIFVVGELYKLVRYRNGKN
jgi:P-type Ca2+ transporter type 2C